MASDSVCSCCITASSSCISDSAAASSPTSVCVIIRIPRPTESSAGRVGATVPDDPEPHTMMSYCDAISLGTVWSRLSRSVGGVSGQGFRRGSGAVCLLGLHLVWCLKFRRRVLGVGVARWLDVEREGAE
jgi:hypothetical protein